jgi:hypothetical protein
MRHRRIVLIAASLFTCGLTLGGCESMDPSEWFNTKKPLPGDRKAVFPEGVPGVPQGVPADLVQGYQPNHRATAGASAVAIGVSRSAPALSRPLV